MASYVEDVPEPPPLKPTAPRAGDALAFVGFAIVVVASVLPWARFNNPRIFGAWTFGWPGVAVLAAASGLAAVPTWRRRWPVDASVQAGALAVLAALVVVGALAYRFRPPLLEGSSLAPLLAVLGALLSLAGAGRKAVSVWRIR